MDKIPYATAFLNLQKLVYPVCNGDLYYYIKLLLLLILLFSSSPTSLL